MIDRKIEWFRAREIIGGSGDDWPETLTMKEISTLLPIVTESYLESEASEGMLPLLHGEIQCNPVRDYKRYPPGGFWQHIGDRNKAIGVYGRSDWRKMIDEGGMYVYGDSAEPPEPEKGWIAWVQSEECGSWISTGGRNVKLVSVDRRWTPDIPREWVVCFYSGRWEYSLAVAVTADGFAQWLKIRGKKLPADSPLRFWIPQAEPEKISKKPGRRSDLAKKQALALAIVKAFGFEPGELPASKSAFHLACKRIEEAITGKPGIFGSVEPETVARWLKPHGYTFKPGPSTPAYIDWRSILGKIPDGTF